jgi:CRP-like cAMP-binding protein
LVGAEIKKALITTPLSEHLEPNELDLLMAHANAESFSTGDVILKQGDYSPGMYIIIEGTAMVSTRTLGSETTQVATLNKGDFVGETSLLMNEPCATSVIASRPIRTLLITNIYLEFLSLFFPELKYKILLTIAKQICNRLINTREKIISFLKKSDMTTQPILGKVFTSFKKAATISYEEADIDKFRGTELFSIFNNDEYEFLFKNSELIKAPKHCTLIDENDKNANCYIVLRGAVQSNIIHNKIVAKLSVIGPNILFCGITTIDPASPSTINFTTCETAILLKITQDELISIQHQNAPLWNKLFSLICKSIVALEKSVQKLNIRLDIELYNR